MYYLNNETVALPSVANFPQRETHTSTLELKTVSINPDGEYLTKSSHAFLDNKDLFYRYLHCSAGDQCLWFRLVSRQVVAFGGTLLDVRLHGNGHLKYSRSSFILRVECHKIPAGFGHNHCVFGHDVEF